MIYLWEEWEHNHGESLIDYFLDDNINSMAFVVGYFVGKFPKLGDCMLKSSNNKIPWKFIQDSPMIESTHEFVPSLSEIVETFYGEGNYEKEEFAWCSLIHDVDLYYEKFINYIKESKAEDE